VNENKLTVKLTFETNIIGTAKVIKAALECDSLEAIVVITSDKCYKNQERSEGYKEDDPLGGDDPYSASKGASELITSSYRNSFFNTQNSCKIATVRCGNVIGGGDWSDYRIIPDSIKDL
jgi:CDP-glucose 4,6-dehydratase